MVGVAGGMGEDFGDREVTWFRVLASQSSNGGDESASLSRISWSSSRREKSFAPGNFEVIE
jgi:hypothetical protein